MSSTPAARPAHRMARQVTFELTVVATECMLGCAILSRTWEALDYFPCLRVGRLAYCHHKKLLPLSSQQRREAGEYGRFVA
jgi:hypothetical protein